MKLLFKSNIDRAEHWIDPLQEQMPELEIQVWPDIGDPEAIEYALMWKPDPGMLAGLPNLKAIFSLGAGIDHLASDPLLPRHIPTTRMVDPGLTSGMTEYVVMQVLFHHRTMLDYRDLQSKKDWRELDYRAAWNRKVTVLGLGVLGSDAAEKLSMLRLDVAGWARSPKSIEGVTCYHGADGFEEALARSEILVNLLPLTEDTRGILNKETFNKLPKGACVINVARGGHLIEEDLLEALESGQVDSATLDVFQTEPLQQESPLWDHPRVVITPHMSSITIPETACLSVVENIRRIEAGQDPLHVVDFDKGY
ncbi:2-hydroxyacid dehydrogenase [Rhodovibrionaceae bacterium A322]